MKKLIILAALGLLSLTAPAAAQSTCPYIAYGVTPTAGQWNKCFSDKQDAATASVPSGVSGSVQYNKAGALAGASGALSNGLGITFSANSLFGALNVAPGTAPATPNNGDVWATSAGLSFRANGVTVGPLTAAVANIAALQAITAASTGEAVPVVGSQGGVFVWTLPASAPGGACTADGGVVFLANGVSGSVGCWVRVVSGPGVNLSWYGLSTSGGAAAANTVLLTAAGNAAAYFGIPLVGYTAVIPSNAEWKIPANVSFAANGMTISCAGAAGSFPDFSCVFQSGIATDLGALSVEATPGSLSFTLASAPTLSPGDTVFLVNKASGSFNGARASYYAGEAVIVISVSTNVVTVAGPLKYDYPTATTKVNKVALSNATVSQLHVFGVSTTSSIIPITEEFCGPQTTLMDDYGYNSTTAGLDIQYCVGAQGRGGYYSTVGSTTSGNNYGIEFVNDSSVNFSGVTAVGLRHGTSIGAADSDYAITNYFVGVDHSTITETLTGVDAVAAADVHGNCYGCYYDHDTINGGAEFGGDHETISNSIITSGTAYGWGQYCLLVSELRGMDNSFDHNTCEVNSNSVNASYGFIDGGTSGGGITANTTQGGTFKVTDNTIRYTVANGSVPSVSPFQFINNGATGITLNLDLRRNDFQLLGVYSGKTAASSGVGVAAGANWNRVDVSGTRGNTGWDIRASNYVIADDYQSNVSGGSYGSSLRSLFIGSPLSVEISGFEGFGGNDRALYISGTTAPTVSINGIWTLPSAYGANAVEVDCGTGSGTGAEISINGFNLPGTHGALVTSASDDHLYMGMGFAASYTLSQFVATNTGLVIFPPATTTGLPSGALWNSTGTPAIH